MYLYKGKRINPAAPLVTELPLPPDAPEGTQPDFVQRPAGWVTSATPEELEDVGVVQAADPVRPDDTFYYVSENEDGSFSAVTKPIEMLRATIWNRIKDARKAHLDSGFTFAAMHIDSDEASRALVVGAVLSAQIALLTEGTSTSWSKNWTMADNTVAVLSASDMVAIGRALDQHVQSVYDRGVELRNAVNSATTLEDLLALTW